MCHLLERLALNMSIAYFVLFLVETVASVGNKDPCYIPAKICSIHSSVLSLWAVNTK